MSYLMHYGTPRHSGRYPWGSGENPFQHEGWGWFSKAYDKLRKEGYSDAEIAKMFKDENDPEKTWTVSQVRARKQVGQAQIRGEEFRRAKQLYSEGYGYSEIGRMMGKNESSIRSLLKEDIQDRKNRAINTAEMLKRQLEQKKFLDVGAGVELYAGVSKDMLKTALIMLEDEGYVVKTIQINQLGTGYKTTVKVLAPPGTTGSDIYNNKDQIASIAEFSKDGGKTFLGIEPPKSVDLSRIKINYKEETGAESDGTILIRRGVPDLSLGANNYAQVRIAVDDKYYLKGVALYSDDMPKGVDIIYNVSKSKDMPINKVLKEMKDDPDNPFGATIKRQLYYTDKDGNQQLSAINIVNEEGDWRKWKPSLSSQFLSKQPLPLINKQLSLAYDVAEDEFNEINSLTNPTVKKILMQKFADKCDSKAVDLKAAALPRQSSHLILPVNSLKDNEVYAPNYRNGERVVLIRYPHEGRFQIPELIVNNNNREARKIIGTDAPDAIGINKNVAEKLSGADFDGDTVLVIPNNDRKIKAEELLKGLRDYDDKEEYKAYPGMPKTCFENGFDKQREMGRISNLITDMTLRGAPAEHLERAVKHSMMIIDAEKHNLDWRGSEKDNNISALKKEYQGGPNKGASTLISRASSADYVNKRAIGYKIDPETGEKIFRETGEYNYKDKKTGKVIFKKPGSDEYYYKDRKSGEVTEIDPSRVKKEFKKQESTKMYEAKDARELISEYKPNVKEYAYADYANKMKKMGNEARKVVVKTPNQKKDNAAAKVYKKQVDSLMEKVRIAEMNAPLERAAQLIANCIYDAKVRANPNMDKDDRKKIKRQALTAARQTTGASKKEKLVDITPTEWEAIQAGAISNDLLVRIIDNSDIDQVRNYAMPIDRIALTTSDLARARSMLNLDVTMADIADALGVSTATLYRYLYDPSLLNADDEDDED